MILFSSDLNESVPSKHFILKLCFQILKKKLLALLGLLAVCGLSPAVASGGYSQYGPWASYGGSFSYYGALALRCLGFSSYGSGALECRLSNCGMQP